MYRIIQCFLILILSSSSIFAHTEVELSKDFKIQSSKPLGSEENPIKIGVMLSKPFATKIEEEFSGFLIEYWTHLARVENWHYAFLPTSHDYSEAVKELSNGKFDMVLGNFSTTYERSFLVDFSRPFMITHVTVLTSVKNVGPLKRFFITLKTLSKILMLVVGLLIIFSILFWIFEKRKHKYSIFNSFFSTSVTMISGAMTQKPSSNFNKFLFICMLIIGMILQAVIIASMTETAISNNKFIDPFQNDKDISGKLFVITKGSHYIDVIKSLKANVYIYDGDTASAAKFYTNNIDLFDGFVTDRILAEFYESQFENRDLQLIVSDLKIKNDELAFMFRKDFPYKDIVNQDILFMQDNKISKSICENYVPKSSYLCML